MKSVHFLTQCALFPTAIANQHYNSLTLSSNPTEPKATGSAYTLTLSPDAGFNTLTNTRVSTGTHSSGGFVSGWLGVIDYPNDQPAINKKFGTDFNIPVVFYSQPMAKAFGLDGKKDAGLNRNTIRSDKLDILVKNS